MQVQFNRRFFQTLFIAFILINEISSRNTRNPRSKVKKTRKSRQSLNKNTSNNSRFKCRQITRLRPHKDILTDFPTAQSLNFIKQQIRHFQADTACHGDLITPFTFLNLLYHHSNGKYRLSCITKEIDSENSVCLSQFLKNTRRFSGKKGTVGWDLLEIVHKKVEKLYSEVMVSRVSGSV